MSQPVIVIDSGNSRTKWGVHDGAWLAQGAIENTQLTDLADELTPWRGCRAVVSSVAGIDKTRQLQEVLLNADIRPQFISAQTKACGLNNGYAQPEQLGSDRWATAVAAWSLCHAPCVVATAGTALTVDAISGKGEFLGGLIVPGLRVMQQALAGSTSVVVEDGRLVDFPDNTADAVQSGALRAMAGAVESMRESLQQREGREPLCLLSGGDASVLLPALHSAARIEDNLVLQGLVLIAGEMA